MIAFTQRAEEALSKAVDERPRTYEIIIAGFG